MIKKFLGALVIVSFVSLNCFAFIDAIINGITRGAKDTADAAYQGFMQIKIVEQIKVLKQNYDESKRFYDDMDKINKSPGGIPGYMSDKIAKRTEDIGNDMWYRVDKDFINTYGNDSYVRKWIASTEQTIETSLNFSQYIFDKSKKRDEDITKVVKDLKSNNKDTVNGAKSSLEALNVELLSSIEKNQGKIIELLAKTLGGNIRGDKKAIDDQQRFLSEIQKMFYDKKKSDSTENRMYKLERALKETPR